jgi:hypothetical protein
MKLLLIEFYKSVSDDERKPLIESIRGYTCPDVGDKINIRGENWLIVNRSWCLDYTDLSMSEHQMRVCLNCKPTDDQLKDLDTEGHEHG